MFNYQIIIIIFFNWPIERRFSTRSHWKQTNSRYTRNSRVFFFFFVKRSWTTNGLTSFASVIITAIARESSSYRRRRRPHSLLTGTRRQLAAAGCCRLVAGRYTEIATRDEPCGKTGRRKSLGGNTRVEKVKGEIKYSFLIGFFSFFF